MIAVHTKYYNPFKKSLLKYKTVMWVNVGEKGGAASGHDVGLRLREPQVSC